MLAPGALAVINADDPAGRRLAAELPHCAEFGREYGSHRIHDEKADADGSDFLLDEVPCRVPVPGAFSVANAAAALLAAAAFGIPLPQAAAALRDFPGVPGRMENLPLGPGRRAVVDYAHTPDGLDKALRALAGASPRPLVCLFGCGGDRDRGKRPLMAAIASGLADAVIVTDDNPRTEDPEQIFADIRPGLVPSVPVRFLHQRGAAIAAGLELIAAGGTLLVAGKGHEDYQIIGTEKLPFSDQDEIRRLAR
jgi:UDP-N-acetylmuramoyl-L-alanyl-D-glutamate--2,6-diaminopimelate ligase